LPFALRKHRCQEFVKDVCLGIAIPKYTACDQIHEAGPHLGDVQNDAYDGLAGKNPAKSLECNSSTICPMTRHSFQDAMMSFLALIVAGGARQAGHFQLSSRSFNWLYKRSLLFPAPDT
jgi:hypothetical protein